MASERYVGPRFPNMKDKKVNRDTILAQWGFQRGLSKETWSAPKVMLKYYGKKKAYIIRTEDKVYEIAGIGNVYVWCAKNMTKIV